jgi:methionyl-tRNA synthetase
VGWGIEVPFSPAHVTYVWFDALLNYISALGWPEDPRFHAYWQQAGAIHLIGKDIVRHHCLYWPILLRELGVEPPRTIFAHGWWLIEGEKMSKSKGNIVDPRAVVEAYGLDAFRYFLLRDVPFGEDGVFSEDALVRRINADLANDLGNLVYRTLTMLEKHTAGLVPNGRRPEALARTVGAIEEVLAKAVQRLAPEEALKAVWELVSQANRSVEENAPWNLARQGRRQQLEQFLYELAESVRVVALWLWPFLPHTSEAIWRQLGMAEELAAQRLPEALVEKPIRPGQRICKGTPLFPRISL